MLAMSRIVLLPALVWSSRADGRMWPAGHSAAQLSTQPGADVAAEIDDRQARAGMDTTSVWLGRVDRLPRHARRSTGETR